VREAGEVRTGILWVDLRERDHLEGVDLDGKMILIWISRKWNREAWTGLLWLITGTGGDLL